MKRSRLAVFSLVALLSIPGTDLFANDPFAEMDASIDEDSIAGKKKEKSDFDRYKRQQINSFEDYKKKLEQEFAEFKKISQQETTAYRQKLGKVWDKAELSSRKVWIEYSKNLKEKKTVDFEKQTITIAKSDVMKDADVSDKELKVSLKSIVTKNKAEAFQDDALAQAIEKKSKEKISLLKTAEVKASPILIPEVKGQPELSDKEIDEIVDRMLKLSKRREALDKRGKKVVTVEVPMDVIDKKLAEKDKSDTTKTNLKSTSKRMADLRINKLPRQARMIENDVNKFSANSNLDASLVYAIIETESAFNPMARSPIPAYGLMQIVPTSAGQDATAQLFGKAKILSPSYLYSSDKNIEVGATYLNILFYRYLKGIRNEESRLYCTIAAYNTGAGNVAKAFTGKRRIKPALSKINALTPQQVYDHLVENLPYEETRKYLAKVRKRMPNY
ncbi:MAG: transglycosylase SLT domain-containing protein [Pseudomonadales bacterium]|nr:transglycosylase SLT domain-containing protein [Pseudomonadales bacterium]